MIAIVFVQMLWEGDGPTHGEYGPASAADVALKNDSL